MKLIISFIFVSTVFGSAEMSGHQNRESRGSRRPLVQPTRENPLVSGGRQVMFQIDEDLLHGRKIQNLTEIKLMAYLLLRDKNDQEQFEVFNLYFPGINSENVLKIKGSFLNYKKIDEGFFRIWYWKYNQFLSLNGGNASSGALLNWIQENINELHRRYSTTNCPFADIKILERVSRMWVAQCIHPILTWDIDATDRCTVTTITADGKPVAELTDFAMNEYLLLVLGGYAQ